MTDQAKDNQEEEEVSSLAMSDEDFPDYPPGDEPVEQNQPEASGSEDTEETIITEEDLDDEQSGHDDEETASSTGEGESEGEISDDTASAEEGSEGASEDTTSEDTEQIREEETDSTEEQEKEEVNKKSSKKSSKKKSKVTETEVSTDNKPTSDAQLQQLFAPFRANGRDMQVSSIEDALVLMKMGANYNKKMTGLKPNLKLMKMLDNNELLDESKLSYLIDLNNKNPEAIAKLLKDSGIDPLTMEENNTEYKPNTYTVNDTEVDLDLVLDELKDTPSFKSTIEAISTKWDAASKEMVQKDPSIIRTINEHMDAGVYDQIMGIVENEKALGRLTDLSDLHAYKHVGDTLHASGAFAQNAKQPDTANVVQPIAKKAQQDPMLNNRRRAAASTKSKPAKVEPQFDPLSLSDEEFEKQVANFKI